MSRYKNWQENALDMLAGRQSQIIPDNVNPLRDYGIGGPVVPYPKSDTTVCKSCGRSGDLSKSLCDDCIKSYNDTRWHDSHLK